MGVYPVVFNYEEVVKGQGFHANVLARGRALMVHDEGEWWMYGVQPGVLAEGGATFDEARLLFRETFRDILLDVASEAPDFKSFKTAVEKTLYQINDPMLKSWLHAVEKVRANAEIEEPLQELPRTPAEEPVAFTITELQPASSTANTQADRYLLAGELAPAA